MNINVKRRPIVEAPKDGTVILSDVGTVCYVDQKHWGSPVNNGWYLCDPNEQPQMVDGVYSVSPRYWISIPDFSEE